MIRYTAPLWEYISIPMHSVHTLSAQQNASVHCLGQGLNRVLLIFLLTMRERIRNKMTGIREKIPKKGETHFLKLFIIMYTPALVCTWLNNIQPFRIVPCTMYTRWLLIKLCDKKRNPCLFKIFTCCLSRAYTAMEKARLYAVHIQSLVC